MCLFMQLDLPQDKGGYEEFMRKKVVEQFSREKE